MSLKNTRVESLDYLRGLMAFGIMIFHYASWVYGKLDISLLVAKIGIYGVSIFYILSGLTLTHVYLEKGFETKQKLYNFYIKRAFRIMPLLWLAIVGTMVVNKIVPSWEVVLLNFTGLFSVFSWDKYIAVGSWSIGNEIFFYCLFPLLIYLARKNNAAFYIAVIFSICSSIVFQETYLTGSNSLSEVWKNYVNPINQLLFFTGGICLAFVFRERTISTYLLIFIIAVCSLAFSFYPLKGDPILIVTGEIRIVYFVISCLLCMAFYKLQLKLPLFIESNISHLGQISYSLYLLHPFSWAICSSFSNHIYLLIPELKIVLAIMLTVVMSSLSYRYFEIVFMNLGRKLIR